MQPFDAKRNLLIKRSTGLQPALDAAGRLDSRAQSRLEIGAPCQLASFSLTCEVALLNDSTGRGL
jgi:hypothetical protein